MKESKIQESDWKFLAGIKANMIFETEYFHHKDCVIRILSDLEDKTEQTKEFHLAEVYSKREAAPDIEAAFYKSIDLLNEFLDQLALISFQPTIIYAPIAITYAKTRIGGEFPMLHQHPSTLRKTISIKESDYINYNSLTKKDSEYYNLLRILNYYQNSLRLDDKFLHLYAVLDQIASIESREYQIRSCDKCGHEIKLNHKATGNYIRKLAEDFKIEDFNLNKIRGFRAKVAHGAKKRDYNFFKELAQYLPILETLVYKVIASRLPISMKLTTNVHMFTPLLTLRGTCKKNKINTKVRFPKFANKGHYYEIIDFQLGVNILFTNVNSDEKTEPKSLNQSDINHQEFFDGSFGINFGPNGQLPISKYAWPYCE